MKFGFTPLSDLILPANNEYQPNLNYSVNDLYSKVQEHNAPNFIGVRIPVSSQLNIPIWKDWLSISAALTFSKIWFPVGFNHNCLLNHDGVNHKSTVGVPTDVDAYIQEKGPQW